MMLMTTMRSLPILLLVSSLCVTEVAGRSWDLPLIAGRIPSTQLRDFRHGSHAYSHLPLVSSLKGGDQAPTGGRGGNSASSSSNSVSDDIGRGGGGAAAVKTKKLAEEMQAATSTSTPARTPPPKKVPKKMAAAAAAATSTPVKPFTENDDVLPKERTGLSRFLPHRKSFNHKALAKKLKVRHSRSSCCPGLSSLMEEGREETEGSFLYSRTYRFFLFSCFLTCFFTHRSTLPPPAVYNIAFIFRIATT